MTNMQKNIFVVGPQATGESFFGRQKDIFDLESSIFDGVGAVHLIGPTRIGKSSLIQKVFERNQNRPNRLKIKLCMGECTTAYEFWITLTNLIEEEILASDMDFSKFERHFSKIEKVDPDRSNWFVLFKLPFQSLLREIGKQNYRLVLAIDEFDSVTEIFSKEDAYFQTLRSMFSDVQYATSGVLISRRRLHLLEVECDHISTFHGVFREKPLLPFSDADMEDFYEALLRYGIRISNDGKEKLRHYTGFMPYLCSMFGERLVAHRDSCLLYEEKEIGGIFKECLPQIDRHYEDLISRLEADDHIEFIFYLSIGSRIPNLSTRDIENMQAMGVLTMDEAEHQYYVFSKDFLTYFKMRPLKLPAWDTITSGEKKIKSLFKLEFPMLDEITYSDLISARSYEIERSIERQYPELNLNWKKVHAYAATLAAHKDDPTVLDVMTLSDVVKVILETWDTRFASHFGGDPEWKHKLEYIKKIRNPVAHAQLECIDKDELSLCMNYCSQIIRL